MGELFDYQSENNGEIDHHWWCVSTHGNGKKCDCGFVAAVNEARKAIAENARLTEQLQAVSDQLTEAVQRAQAAERELSKAQKGISYLARATEHAINYLASGVIDNESRINSLHNLKRWQHKSGVAKAD